MKKIVSILAFAAAILAASCEKKAAETEIPAQEPEMVPASVTATIAETKVSLSGVSPQWSKNDQIAVYTTSGSKCSFTTQDSGSTAVFSGTKPEGSTLGFAVYPYSAAVSVSSGTYTLSVPAEQDGKLTNAVMAAKAGANGETFAFENLSCVVKLNIPSSLNIRKVELVSDSALSGNFTVNGSTLAVTAPSSPSEAAKTVSVSSSSALSGDVLIAIIPSSGKNLQMVLTNASGKCVLISKDLGSALTKGHIKNLGSVPTGITFSDVAKIGSSTSSQSTATASQPSKPQIINGDFETWSVDGVNLPTNWNSFQTAGGSLASSGYDSGNRQVQRNTDKRPGSSGNYSCLIWSRRIYIKIIVVIADVVAQGNLTTGQVIAGNMDATGTGNYNKTSRNQTDKSTGNPLYSTFTGRPDSMAVWVKFIPYGTDSAHPYAKVEAFLHDNSDYQRGYNAADCTGGTVIAQAVNNTLQKTNSEWKRLSIPFTYSSTSNPSYALINIATNAYPGGGNAEKNSTDVTKADRLYIDDLEMIYNRFNLKTSSTGWATLCLNYDALVPSGATAYIVTKVACGYASLKEIPAGTVIPKNTGVLVKGSANTTYAFNGSASDISGKTKASVSGNLLRGTLSNTSKPSGTCRVLSSESSSSLAAFGAFTGSTIAANTAYLTQ
ncbi:MAG: hypothetical protein J6S62_04900 [Bacteroidales bacterium]|nr:hypothetical protein [Bacteroidales bacterium]